MSAAVLSASVATLSKRGMSLPSSSLQYRKNMASENASGKVKKLALPLKTTNLIKEDDVSSEW